MGSEPKGSVNPVVAWDLNAQTAIWDVARQQPKEQVRSFAMVNGAVYDAVNAIAGVHSTAAARAAPKGRITTAAASTPSDVAIPA